MWMGIIQSDDGLNRKKLTFFEEEKLVSALRWVFSLSVHLADFGLASLHNCMILKINKSLLICIDTHVYMYIYTQTHIYTHIRPIGSISLENPN